MSNKIYLCSIKDHYIDYLREFDKTVLKNKNSKRKYIGVLFEIDDKNYYAPLASPKPKHLKISNKAPDIVKIDNGELGVINLNNMIPVPESEIINFNINNVEDEKYKNLLRDQVKYIQLNRKNIIKKAKRLYSIFNSGKHPLINARCCNFKLLERKCAQYSKEKEGVRKIVKEASEAQIEVAVAKEKFDN
jgi:protein AbiQ